MKKIAVIYWSGTGNTEEMAELIHQAAEKAGAESTLFEVSDFNPETIDDYDRAAFGCPAMGDEELEEEEFLPVYEACRPHLKGKEIVLFGSYNWAEGEWMERWAEQAAEEDGAVLLTEPLICRDDPSEDEAVEALKAAGEALAS